MSNRSRSVLSIALLLLSHVAWPQTGDRIGEVQSPPPAHLNVPHAPALSAEEALKTFRVAPGFKVQIVASDPLVFDPVAMSIGADGRIWVVEMRAFMPNVEGKGEDAPIGSVAVLEDTNGDGRMDKRTEFAGGFVLPRAVAPLADGVLVAEPPNLWFLQDLDGDNKADKRTRVADDYGNPSNPEHTANGLMWAMDNWIYSANHTVRLRYERGQWRHEPTIFRGQWGITQDDYGRLFYNSNSDPLRMDVVPAEYLRRNEHLVEPSGTNVQLVRADELPVWPGRVTPGINRGYLMLREDGTLPAVTAACGPVVYRGALFPETFRGNAFIAEPAGNLVKRVVIEERNGVPHARNAYTQTEFLTSTDERFRPVNLYNGPDGALYVIDMYRGIIQHRIFLTTYLRNQIEERGLDAPLGMGRIYRIVPDGAAVQAPPDLSTARLAERVAALEHEEAWWRDTAQRLLVESGDPRAVPAVRALVKTSPFSLARLHALWTLDGLDAVDWASVQEGLRDPDVHVAVAAARLAERFFDSAPERTLQALKARATWTEPVFLRQLALSLGTAASAAAESMLVHLAQQSGSQPYMADAIVSSLAGRELAFLERLVRDASRSLAYDAATPVIASLSAAILNAGKEKDIGMLFAHLQREAGDAWLHSAILDGVERFIPGEKNRQRTAFVPSEPQALIAFARGDTPLAERARDALELLRWQGQQIDPAHALATLTDQQRAWFEQGREAYAVCAACHQPDGQGMEGLAPPLVGSRWATGGADALVRIVLNGKLSEESVMPPLRSLDDETIAAILTFIRRAWGHASAPISIGQVKAIRSQIEDRQEPWTEPELEPMN